jgi:hypothetical protein
MNVGTVVKWSFFFSICIVMLGVYQPLITWKPWTSKGG